jgi:hypothetical protein
MATTPKRKPVVEIGPIHILDEIIDYGSKNAQSNGRKTKKPRGAGTRCTKKQRRKK